MHDAAAVRVFERVEQRAQDVAHRILVAGVVALAEVAAREVGHGEPRQAVAAAADVVDADDVRVPQPGNRAVFVFKRRRLISSASASGA